MCRSEEDEKKLHKILPKDRDGPLSRQEEEEREKEKTQKTEGGLEDEYHLYRLKMLLNIEVLAFLFK